MYSQTNGNAQTDDTTPVRNLGRDRGASHPPILPGNNSRVEFYDDLRGDIVWTLMRLRQPIT